MSNIDKVWQNYQKTRSPAAKEQLILQYAHLVKYTAGRLHMTMYRHMDIDDLISYGVFGLIDAIERYSSDMNTKFETYAAFRIKGTILDSLREMDWVPRDTRRKQKRLKEANADLEIKLNREPTEAELAEWLGLTIEETRKFTKQAADSTIVSLDSYLEQNHESEYNHECIPIPDKNDPETMLEKEEVRRLLVQAIEGLTEQQRQVITLYYFEELTLREISRIIGLTESRISQIHLKGLEKMEAVLGTHRSLLLST